VAEWSAAPDVNAALDFYMELLDLIRGRVREADGSRELNAALKDVLAGLWCEMDDNRLLVDFALRADPGKRSSRRSGSRSRTRSRLTVPAGRRARVRNCGAPPSHALRTSLVTRLEALPPRCWDGAGASSCASRGRRSAYAPAPTRSAVSDSDLAAAANAAVGRWLRETHVFTATAVPAQH
jgi:hypothetical protein